MNRSYWTGFLSGTTVLALGMVFVVSGSGFQANSVKIGVVDSRRATSEMVMVRTSEENLQNMLNERKNLMAYLDEQQVIAFEDAKKLKELSLKATVTEADKAAITKIKTTAAADKKKYEDLQTVTAPTAAQQEQINQFVGRAKVIAQYKAELNSEFSKELTELQNKMQSGLEDGYKDTVTAVGKKQGFTIVFDKGIAPYAANDITKDVIDAANAKK